ncbi:hypothetical protein [Spirosoma utsteinense]|uniref:Phage baseplate assembly protein gpV n=1 Tax=Spirosoma utsteinense TaxID=2585773 RepID=A0ABR6WA67_9BACT|nr:hypothetical protein [Spirosoma utsteinense]MBC3793456.1 phage baseplate assembly protein gpV [Spirosoma utsteinense]
MVAIVAVVLIASMANVQVQDGKMKKKADVVAAKTEVTIDKADMKMNK